MNDENLYSSSNLANAIQQRAKKQNVTIKDMLNDCNLGSNTMSALYHGKSLAFDSLAKIADYLNCSVDYLLGKTDFPTVVEEQLAKEEFALFGEVKELTDEEKQRVLDFIKFTKEQRKDK